MKCHGCNSSMILDKQESGSGSNTQWHRCPVCRKVRLTSQPANTTHQSSYSRSVGKLGNNPSNARNRKGTPYFA